MRLIRIFHILLRQTQYFSSLPKQWCLQAGSRGWDGHSCCPLGKEEAGTLQIHLSLEGEPGVAAPGALSSSRGKFQCGTGAGRRIHNSPTRGSQKGTPGASHRERADQTTIFSPNRIPLGYDFYLGILNLSKPPSGGATPSSTIFSSQEKRALLTIRGVGEFLGHCSSIPELHGLQLRPHPLDLHLVLSRNPILLLLLLRPRALPGAPEFHHPEGTEIAIGPSRGFSSWDLCLVSFKAPFKTGFFPRSLLSRGNAGICVWFWASCLGMGSNPWFWTRRLFLCRPRRYKTTEVIKMGWNGEYLMRSMFVCAWV